MSLKQLLCATVALFSSAALSAQGINFAQGTWAEVTAKAKAENKYIFVDAYAEWCGPCKWMAKNVFTDAKVGTHFSEKYVSYKFDMEKGEGPEFAKKYTVSAYPTLLFFNSEAELVHKVLGAQPADQLLAQSEKALDPAQQIFSMKKKFEAGERNPDFLYKYTMALLEANEDAGEASALYMKTQKKEDWNSAKNFDLIAVTQNDMKSEIFKHVVANRAVFEKTAGKEKVSEYIEKVIYYAINEVAMSHDAAAYTALKTDISKMLGDKSAAMNALLDMQYYIGEKDEFKYTKIYFDKYCDNANQLNGIAWEYFETQTDKKKLKAALAWANKSVTIGKNWYNLDTKANLLNKLGNKKEAIATAEEAIKVAKASGEDPSETEKFLKELKAK